MPQSGQLSPNPSGSSHLCSAGGFHSCIPPISDPVHTQNLLFGEGMWGLQCCQDPGVTVTSQYRGAAGSPGAAGASVCAVPVCQRDDFVGCISLLLTLDFLSCRFLKLCSESCQVGVQVLQKTPPRAPSPPARGELPPGEALHSPGSFAAAPSWRCSSCTQAPGLSGFFLLIFGLWQ